MLPGKQYPVEMSGARYERRVKSLALVSGYLSGMHITQNEADELITMIRYRVRDAETYLHQRLREQQERDHREVIGSSEC